MPRKNPYLKAQNVKETPDGKVVSGTSPLQALDDGVAARARLRAAIDSAPVAASPSLAEAQRHDVVLARYTEKEQDAAKLAMDFNLQASNALSFVASTGFPGFPTLALLGQLSEYRSMHERLADECVRAWGKVVSTGAADDGKLKQLEAELKRIDLRGTIRALIVQEQAFGRAHALIKLKGDEKQLTTPLVLKPFTVKKGAFEGVRTVEAYWVSPNNYNSIDPSQPDFYKPSSWWMLGQEAHSTRLFTLVSRPVADMLKPAYSFAGVSMSQLAMPYIDNWLRTRQSVSDTVKQFSITGVLMDLQQALAPGGNIDLQHRAQLFNAYRDSRNLALLDKATEEFFQINTPLSGLSDLQAQAQEQMSAVSHMPLVVLTGITPNGLNASSDGEIRVWYDYVMGYLNANITGLIHYVLKVAQLSLFGAIDDSVGWEWFPLMQETLGERSERMARDADTDTKYVEIGTLTNEQVGARLESDPHSMYAHILKTQDVADIPSTDIEAITEHILAIQPPEEQEQLTSQAGSSVATESSELDSQAAAISTPHSRDVDNAVDDSGATPDPRKKMGV